MKKESQKKVIFLPEEGPGRPSAREPGIVLPEIPNVCPALSSREAGSRYRALIEHSSVGVVILEEGGRCLSCNARFSEMMGCNREKEGREGVGSGEIPQEDGGILGSLAPEVDTKGDTSRTVRCRLLRTDGAASMVELSIRPILHEDTPLYLGIVRDITEQKRLEDALQESESRYRALFEGTSDAITLLDGGVYVACNSRALMMFGCEKEQLIGRTPYGFSTPLQPDGTDSREAALRRVRAALSGTPQFFEWRHCRLDGTAFDAEVTLSAIRIGHSMLLQGVVRDITARKEAERALLESEERYRQTVENFPDAIVLHDGEAFLYLNQAALRLYGVFHPRELMGRRVVDYLHEEDRAIVRERIARIEETGIPFSLREIRVLRVNGEVVPIDLTAGTVVYHGSRVLQVIFRDISRRKAAEKALRESEERYRNIFENAMVGIFRSTWEGKYFNANPALARIHGFDSPEEMMSGSGGMRPDLYVHQEDQARYYAALESAGLLQGFEVEMYRRDGSTVWVSMNVRRVPDSEGRLLYDEGIVEDVTERKRAEEALWKRERELEVESVRLEEANAALRVLLRHRDEDKQALEKTIMENVKGLVFPYIEKLRGSHLGDAQAAYLNILEANLNDILSPFLQKMNAVYTRFTPTEVHVANLIKNGKTTKEIAELLNVSAGTVNSHRNSIRSKLGFRNKQVNLRTYLMSL